MGYHQRLEQLRKGLQAQRDSGGGYQPRYPDRQIHVGSDVWVIRPGETSWGDLAYNIYGDVSFSSQLRDSNPNVAMLYPGLQILLPDAVENPQVQVQDMEFHNTAEFAQLLNSQEEQRRLLSEYRKAEVIWPEHGERVYLTFDEDNSAIPTTDPQGWPMYWDDAAGGFTPVDTGVFYTMGMLKNDFIKPLSIEDQRELTLMGEQRFRPEAMAYYAQAAESEEFQLAAKTEMLDVIGEYGFNALPPEEQAKIVEYRSRESAWVKTLNQERQNVPTKLSWWESALDAFGLLEEPFRALANVSLRESEKEGTRPGINLVERQWKIITATVQMIGPGLASYWTGIRSFYAGVFGEDELSPYAIDPVTRQKLTPDEVEQRMQPGRAVGEVKYVSPQDYWRLEIDRASSTHARWWMTLYGKSPASRTKVGEDRFGTPIYEYKPFKHFGGIYVDQFENEDEYEAFIGGLYAFYPEESEQAIRRSIEVEEQDNLTRLEHKAKMDNLMEIAFEHQRAGNGEFAIKLMREALGEANLAAHTYSPYFMWSELNEPWRMEAFLDAATVLTLENGEALEPKVIRDLRRRYEHTGMDIFMGVLFDVLNIPGGSLIVKQGARSIGRFANLVQTVKVGDTIAELKPARPVIEFLTWITSEADSSTGTTLRRITNNLTYNASRGVDVSVSQPGVRGLDEELELLFRGIMEDPELLNQLNVHSRSPLQIANAQRMIALYDPNSKLAAVQKINPKNIGGLVDEARRLVWDAEYERALRELKPGNPEWGARQLEAEAARVADKIASKPGPVSRQIGVFYEQAWRALKQTVIGSETLDDNIIVQFVKLIGQEDHLKSLAKGFKMYYGMRNWLFKYWLGLSPSWTARNYPDSTVRALVSGGRLFDDMGVGHAVNIERLLARHLVREEFTSTMAKSIRGIDESNILIEPVIDKALRGQKFKWGPLSHINDKRRAALIEKALEAELRPPTGTVGRVTRFIVDQLSVLETMLQKGNIALNEVTEFGLRSHTFAILYDNAFEPMNAHNIEVLVEAARAAGATDETVSVLTKLWVMSGDDANKLATLLTVRNEPGRAGTRPVVFSELLPDNFEEVLEKMLVDRRLRTLIFRPLVEDIEAVVRRAPNAQSAADEVGQIIEDAIRAVDEEFVARSDEFAPQPVRIDDAEDVGRRVEEADLSDEAAETVELGAGTEDLEVTVTQLDTGQGTINYGTDAYYEMGELQKESTARLFDARQTLENSLEAGEITAEQFKASDVYLSHVDRQLRFFQSRVQRFFVEIWPGPKRLPAGTSRNEAWDTFWRLGERVYESTITYTDEAIEAAVAGKVDDLPSLENLLRTSGIELQFEGTRLAAIRINDEALGTVTSFGQFHGTNWLKGHLAKTFFGPKVNLNNIGEFFRQPFTYELRQGADKAVTRSEVAEQLASQFGEEIGRATDQAIREADAAWLAVVNDLEMGGGLSLRQRWGSQATASRADFLQFLDDEIRTLQEMGLNDESIGAVQSLRDEIVGIGITIDQLTDPLAVASFVPRPLPRWMMEQGIQTWLNMQRGLSAERSGLTRSIRAWGEYLDEGLRAGTINLDALPADQADILRALSGEASDRKMMSALIAADGTQEAKRGVKEFTTTLTSTDELNAMIDELDGVVMGVERNRQLTQTYKGAVRITQDDLLEYGKNYRFDNMIKFFSPFWMFQSRSPLFWIRSFAQHPEYLAWWSRYHRATRKDIIDNGATDSKGRPLNSKFGHFRIPGTSTYFAPLHGISGRYILPRPNPYPSEFADNTSAMEVAMTHLTEYGQMFGFRFGPWLTYPMYWKGVLDPNRIPIGGIAQQIDLIPPWIQRDIMRGLRVQRYPNDPGKFNPDVGWQDYLIQVEMLGIGYLEMQENPDEADRIVAEMKEALGYIPGERDELGVPVLYQDIDTVPFRGSARWIQARDKLERASWEKGLVGFFTGVYPKEMTDAEYAMLANRDEFNFLADSINSVTGVHVFDLDPVAESRQEYYMENQFETAPGYFDQLYGSVRWTQLPDGGQAYGPDRIDVIASRIWEDEVSAAYHDALNIASDKFAKCQKTRKIGDDPSLKRACWGPFLQQLARIDDHPVFDVARRSGTIGYKTEANIQKFFEARWWRYVNATYPHYYWEDGQEYEDWQLKIVEWKEDLPLLAEEIAATFQVQEIAPKTGDYETGEGRDIPGGRVLIEEALLHSLVEQTNEEGWAAHKQVNDTAYDVMNDAWEALRWQPWMELVGGLEDLNSYEGEQAQRAFLDKYGDPPEADELMRWVFENTDEGRWTPEQLMQVFGQQGVENMEHRLLPDSPRGVEENDIWDKLAYVGPGENFKIFEEEFILSGGPLDVLNAWYETGGHLADFEQVQELLRYIDLAEAKLDLGKPSQAQLVEYGQAKRLNDDFRLGIENALGEEFYGILSIYGSLPRGDVKKQYKKDNEVVLEQYFEAREFYADENQLWAKYYYPKFYKGGVGIPGEGAEGRPGYQKGGGGGFAPKSTYKPASLASRGIKQPPIVPMGYRSSYFVEDLHDPTRLGSGGIGGRPYWPAGFGKGVPQGVLTEIVNVFEKEEPLSNPAVEYLKKKTTWEEYIKELLDFNKRLPHTPRQFKFGP